MYSMSESLLSVVASTWYLLVVTIVCTVLAIRGCVKQNRFTKLMKVIISYWIVWIYMAFYTMVDDRLHWPTGGFESISRFLSDHAILARLLSILSYLGWFYIANMPWVILTWLLINKEYGMGIRRPENE